MLGIAMLQYQRTTQTKIRQQEIKQIEIQVVQQQEHENFIPDFPQILADLK